MTTLVIVPPNFSWREDAEVYRVLDDFYEAVDYSRTGFVTRVALTGWHQNGLPRYETLKELTWIEGFLERLMQ